MTEQFAFERTEALNAAITAWADKLRDAARSTAPAASGELRNSIRRTCRKDSGQIYRISVGFEKQGIYVHVGAGRGYGGFKGGKFYSEAVLHKKAALAAAAADPKSKKKARAAKADGHMTQVNPRSIGRMGTGARPANHWLAPHIERLLPELALAVQQYQTDAWIKSKGFSTTIKL